MFDHTIPLETDDDVLAFAREVIGVDGGGGRTTWVLLLDEDGRPLPMLIPIDGMPVDPDPQDVDRFAAALQDVVDGTDAEQVIVVWERPGGGAVRMQEADWASAVARTGLPVRAQLLATDDGVRLLDPVFEAIVAG